MTGTEAYNNNFDMMSKKRIQENIDKPFLAGFYNYLLADTSYSGSYGYLGNVIKFVNNIGITNPETISLQDYTTYFATIKTKSSSYRIMVYSALKKFSSYLKANGYAEDYMQYIKRPKFKESIKTKKKRDNGFMTEDEVKLFIDSIKLSNKPCCWKARDLAMVKVLLNSGIRCSALQKLDIDDVNFERKTIEVLEKGEESREIYLSNSTIEDLKNWMFYRDNMVNESERALFISNHKSRITETTIYNTIKNYGTIIENKNITPHKTRATYGTTLYNATHDLFFVQINMGHSSPKTTELYIRGQGKQNAKKASNVISNIFE